MKDTSNYYPSYKEKLLADGQRLFDLQLYGIEGVSGYIGDVEVQFILQRHSNLVNQLQGEYYLMCNASVNVDTGSIVKDDKNIVYLVTSNVEETIVYKKMLIRECSAFLTLNKNSILSQIPCVIGNGTQGLEDGKYFSTPDNVTKARIQNNNTNSQIGYGEIFKIGRHNWKVTSVDDISENGIIILGLEWTDDQPKIIPEPEPIQPIIINGETSIIKGYAKTYTVDNSEIGEVEFSIIGNLASIQSQNGVAGTCTVLAGDILENVRLWCKTIDGLVEGYKDIRIRSIF